MQESHVIVEALGIRGVGSEAIALPDGDAAHELERGVDDRFALPTPAGLDAEQIVAAPTIPETRHRLAPGGFVSRLSNEYLGCNAQPPGSFLSVWPHPPHERRW